MGCIHCLRYSSDFKANICSRKLALLCQKACGVMDQMASACVKANKCFLQ
ncbi:hypothetical protein Hanom_Chr05g00420001 [Helianthus anomalus]